MSPLASPHDLTLPAPGTHTLRDVLSAALSRALRELASLRVEPSLAPAWRALVTERVGSREGRGALTAALRRPTVGTFLRALRGRPRDEAAPLARALAASLALELACMGALEREVRLPSPPPRALSLVGLRALDVPQGTHALTLGPERATLEGPDGARSLTLEALPRPFVPLRGGLVLALVDDNPLSMIELHPDKEGNAVSLGGRPEGEWAAALGEALDLVAAFLPEVRREMDLALHQVVPVGYHAERHLSASYQEALGTVYMTLHPSLMTLAEALVHEFSHGKLNTLLELDPVLENAFSSLHRSPVRPDPRPLHGVLLAAHAFLPIEAMYLAMLEAEHPLTREGGGAPFRARLAQIRASNREATRLVVVEGRPTPLGRGVVDELASLDARFEARALDH